MALTQLTASTAIIAALADLPNATSGLTAAQLKAKFDEAPTSIKTYINDTLLAELAAVTDGSSGADNIGATAITGLTGATVQTLLEALKTKIDSVNPVSGFINIKDSPYNAVGDGTTNDTTAIDSAISAGGYLYLPAGSYVYTGAQASYVSVFGPGKIVDGSGNPHARFIFDLGTTGTVSNLDSYLGFINLDYATDNGTRVYIIPRAAITTGTGGAIKIFGDAYHLGQDYRDFGLYFSADQNSENGYAGNGVFWLNSKVGGATYANGNPDIGISFQDGAVVVGRFIYINNDGLGERGVFVVGSGDPAFSNVDASIGLEVQKTLGIKNDVNIKWRSNDTTSTKSIGVRLNTSDQFIESLIAAKIMYFLGVETFRFDPDYFESKVGIRKTDLLSETGTNTTLNVTRYNRVSLAQTSATTILTLTGSNGQEVDFLFTNGNSTIANGASIKLAGGVNFVGSSNDILTLINISGTWYEKSRSVN